MLYQTRRTQCILNTFLSYLRTVRSHFNFFAVTSTAPAEARADISAETDPDTCTERRPGCHRLHHSSSLLSFYVHTGINGRCDSSVAAGAAGVSQGWTQVKTLFDIFIFILIIIPWTAESRDGVRQNAHTITLGTSAIRSTAGCGDQE